MRHYSPPLSNFSTHRTLPQYDDFIVGSKHENRLSCLAACSQTLVSLDLAMGIGPFDSVKMKAFPGMQKYTPISDSSSSNGAQPALGYELQQQKASVRPFSSPSYADEDEEDELRPEHRKTYSVVTSSELPDTPFPPGGNAEKVNTGFNPLFTRRWILLCFAVLWVLIIASLQVIYTVSQNQQGLAKANTNLRLVWTYGPTAVLVLVTVLWRQVDYAGTYLPDVS